MFPQITKNKKKPKVGTDEMIKECEEVMKQLQFKHKKALKVLPSELVSDFHKVCRLKDIRPFYSQYFFHFIQLASKQNIETFFAQQVQNIMLGRSYYQQIESLLKDRTSILASIKEQLHVIEGFAIMNSGKNLPIALKGMINNLIKDCTSLEQLKTIEINQVNKLTEGIQKTRDNLKEVSEMLISWEFRLRSFSANSQPASFKKMKILFPENGINCIFLGLYDTQFIKTSFLAQQMKFLPVQFDPFLNFIESTKKTSRIFKEHLIDPLTSKGSQYKKIESYIIDSIPKNQQKLEEERQKEKQKNKDKQKQLKRAAKSEKKFYTLEKQKVKEKRKSEKKIMNQFLTSTIIEGKNQLKLMVKNSKNQINTDNIFGIYKKQKKSKPSIYKDQNFSKSLSRSKSQSIESLEGREGRTSRVRSVVIIAEREVTVSQSDNRSKKSIGSIDKEKVMSKTVTNMKKLGKIESVYKMSSSRNHSINKVSPPKNKDTASINTEDFKQQKEELLREINRQKKQQETLKKIIKKVQNRTSSENKLYEKKMQQYEKQINSLKQRIRDRQARYEKSPQNSKQQRNKNNELISKVYQRKKNGSPSKIKQQYPQVNMAHSRLIEENNANKMLQNKIKQLMKEKNKLQNLISKQGDKANKQKEMQQRKLQKYQEIINSLKNQSPQNQLKNLQLDKRFSLIANKPTFDDSPKKSITKEQRLLKLYSKRQTVQAVGHQKQTKLRKSPDNTKETKIQVSESVLKNEKSQLRSEDRQDASDLKITNDKNTIEIVYNPKKNKKSKKKYDESTTLNQPNLSISRQKQQQYQKQLSRLEKQKTLLQRKLDLKMEGKTGTEAVLMKKLQQSQLQLQKYRQIVEKEKSTNIRYDERMKELRKKINQEYEQKIERQRKKFQEEKQHLFYKLKEERESKMEKDKYLSKQMIFLKEMQMRQNQLLTMLQNQRQQRLEKERQLQEEILQKQQVLQEYELEQIKRVIEKQVRQEMNLINQEEEEELLEEDQRRAKEYEKTKAQVEQEIQEMLLANDYELKEIDEQNEKLKELIDKIKQQEQKIITHLQTGIVNDQQEENQQLNTFSSIQMRDSRLAQHKPNTSINNKSRIISGISQKQNFQIHLETQLTPQERQRKMILQLQHKSDLQLQTQRLTISRYKELQDSPVYKQKQKIQNIIEYYLKNPHQYPSNNKIVMKPQQKTNLIEEITLKSKKAKQFEQQLMELKNVQNFVPAQRDDPISNHMLNLRQAYENQQAEALRKILFPAFNQQEKYNQDGEELSFESEEPPPPVTFGDHLKVHEDQYMENKKQKKASKNFMAINKLKLLKIQEEKKQKQRQQIEQETKKKLKKIIYKAKKKEEKDLKEFLEIKKELEEKQRKRQIELQMAKKGTQSMEKIDDIDLGKQKKQEKSKETTKNDKPQEQENEFLVKEQQVPKIKEKKISEEKKDNKSRNQTPCKVIPKAKIGKQEIEKSKQKEFNKSDVKPKEQKIISTPKQLQNEKQLENEDQNEFLSDPQHLSIKQQRIQGINDIKKDEKRQVEEKAKVQEFLKRQDTNKSLIKTQKQETSQKDQSQSEIKHNQLQQQKEKQQIEVNQRDEKGNQEKKQEQEDDYEEDFEQNSQGEPNEFIPKQSQALKESKEKLSQGKNKSKSQMNNQQDKQEQQQQKPETTQNNQQNSLQQNNTQNQQYQPHLPHSNPNHPSQQQQLSQNLPLLLLQHQRSSLKQDLLSYQQQIRSYISSYSQFQVYQHFLHQKQLLSYVDQLLQLSSEEIKKLNNNPSLKKDLPLAQSLIILIAKDKQTKLQLGIGVFHKEFQYSQYVCGYLLAHDMKNFLNLTFNFSRYIYQHDSFCHSVQYIFTISALLDQSSKLHFEDFQNKCKRLGEIYVKGKQSATRKYVLKRHLFEYISNQQSFNEQKGIIFATKIQLHENHMKQKNQGYNNPIPQKHTSPTVLLSIYLKNNPELLQNFKSQVQDDLKNRQTLVTSMVFAKKELTFKTVETQIFNTGSKIQLYKNVLGNVFAVDDIQQQVEEMKFSLSQVPPKNFKRCILDMNQVSTPYCFIQFEQALNRVQASNSAQIGTFIPLVPKFKVLIIPADEFLTSCSSNPYMNVFFYTKHFIKNITEVKKENIPRVYLPEIKDENWTFFRDVSEKLNKTVFGRQKIQIGFESKINNSVIFTPKHDDLVIEKPFIISVLSASIERAIEGSPIFCRLIA